MNTQEIARRAKEASFRLPGIDAAERNALLRKIGDAIDSARPAILQANEQDVAAAEADGLNSALLKRLILNDAKIDTIVAGVRSVAALPDPLNRTLTHRELDDGLILRNITVPIGVIGVIFESRPDALVQISSLCIKSGNALLLKGGREAAKTNRVLFDLIYTTLTAGNRTYKDSIHLVETREEIRELLAQDRYIDLMIPRGSNSLVRFIQENTRIPVLGHADGICHLYLHADAAADDAVRITVDSKTQYPAVCNALETLLINASAAERLLPELKQALAAKGVEIRGDERVCRLIDAVPASDEDWRTEYNDLVLSIKLVDSLEEAIDHINRFGSHHTDAIASTDRSAVERFLAMVDSSSVMVNCSTRFADGFRYGLGSEVGISTAKIHARGPVGLEGLTTTKYILSGTGQIVAPYAEGRKSFTHKDLG